MDEVRAVLTRLRRIDALRRERAGAPAVLAEVELLVDEARDWLAAEGGDEGGGGDARAAPRIGRADPEGDDCDVSRVRIPAGARAIAPIAVTVPLFAISYGVLARAADLGVAAPIVMSATTFAGSAQFAVASILDGGGGVIAAIVAALLLNARYAAIGLSVASLFRGSPLRRLAESQLVVDESWAVSARPDGTFDRSILLGAGVTLYALWVGGTAVGVLGGGLIGDPGRLGLDAAFPALFLALLAGQLVSRRAIAAAVAGGGIAVALLPFAPPGVPIVAAVAGCLAGLRR